MRCLVLLYIFLLFNLANAQKVSLKLASDVWPPFTNHNEKEALALDLVKEALKRAEIGVETNILDFESVMDGISKGEYDGSAALWKSAEREEVLYFSVPYLQNQLVLVARKGNDVSATSLSELAGKRLAVVGNYAYGALVDSAMGIELVSGKDDQQNLDRLLQDEADYMLADALLIEYLLTYQKEEAITYLEIGEQPLISRSLHFAIRQDLPEARQIIQDFNREIIKMRADGTYNRILHLNWISADVDGDGKMELVTDGKYAGKYAPTNGYGIVKSTSTEPTYSNRYMIQGQIYKDWNSVPERYKNNPKQNRDPGTLMRFSF